MGIKKILGIVFVFGTEFRENILGTESGDSVQQVQRVKGSGTRLEFDLSNQPGGTYFVIINTDGRIINKKVVKAL